MAISCAVTVQLIRFFVLAYYAKFWVSLDTAEIDVNENNVKMSFSMVLVLLWKYFFFHFCEKQQQPKMTNLSIPARAVNAIHCQFHHSRKQISRSTSHIRTVYTESALLLKNFKI